MGVRLTITTGGSRGDVQPYVALGLGLKEAGHEVTLAAPATFEGLVRERGLGFYPISLDPLEGIRRQLEKGDANLFEFAWRSRGIFAAVVREDLRAYMEACKEAEAIIYTSVGFLGYRIAEELGIPKVGAVYGPLLSPTRAYPCSFVPVPSGSLEVPLKRGASGLLEGRVRESARGVYNRLSYPLSQQLLWQLLRGPVNEALRKAELSPFTFWGPFEELSRAREPVLNGWSRHVLPRPPDWVPWLEVTGYWFLDRPEDWRPPPGLADFIESGPPPVSVGFGSMTGGDAEKLTDTVVRALRRVGRRGVLVSGFGGFSNADLPEELFKVEEVPYDWLFPRVAAAVHHGGAGTTALSLRAGTPTVVVPFFTDQSFWGARVAGLGVGPRPLPRAQLSVELLAGAMGRAVNDPGMRERARFLGEKIRAEDGVRRAVEAFHRHLRAWVAARSRSRGNSRRGEGGKGEFDEA
jgi:sterol 3beta-glucosyltransferase